MSFEKYKFLLIPFATLIICQLIKFTIESIQAKKLKWLRLLNGTGGMPSSHTSFSTSVTMMVLYEYGLSSPLFAISLVYNLIVAYDSMGLRMESGKQAVAINLMAEEVFDDNEVAFKHLKEELGHKPLEVLAGILLATITTTVYNIII